MKKVIYGNFTRRYVDYSGGLDQPDRETFDQHHGRSGGDFFGVAVGERRPWLQSFRPPLLLLEKTDQRPGLLRSQFSILLPAQTGAEIRPDVPASIDRRGDRLVCSFERHRVPQYRAQWTGVELKSAGRGQ